MESDISLIEVAGEDDSLLQQIPQDDLLNLERKMEGSTAGNSGFFLCSPLLTGRSNATIAGSSTASSADYTDKENINANNIEGPKLNIMPQQMKKKKKAGGYNLRKSLAWNKAFFTEEGVLDSVELSMITGSTSTSCVEALGAIDEEIPAESSGGCYKDLSLKDKLFKDMSISTPSAGRKNGRCLMPKRGSSTKDNVKLKEPSAKDVNWSGSKRGSCPRPAASSSVKRPIISTATKIVNKEERIPRIPVPKRDPIPTTISRAPRNAASIRASDAKSNPVAQRVNQVAQRAGSIPKMTTCKGPSINAKRALNKDVNASKSLKAKSSIEQPRRKLANPVLKVNPLRLQYGSTDSNEGLKAVTNSLISKPLSLNDDGTKKVSASITQNAASDGRSMLNQTQMPKPSGLRMPSPSMGFFGQKKVSSFQSVPPDTSELHSISKSSIPNVRLAGHSNPICQLATLVPRNVTKANDGEASEETNVVSCLGSGSSLEPVSHDKAKSALKVANIHSGKMNVSGASTMNEVLSIHGLENPVLEHLGDVTRIHDEIQDQLDECQSHRVPFNFGDSTKSHLDETNDLCLQGMRKALDDPLSGVQNCYDQSSEQVELTNSSNFKIERTSPDHERLGIGTSNSLKRSRSSIEFDRGGFGDVSNDSNGQERCSFEQDEAFETHKVRVLRTRKAEASDLDRCISNECNNTMQSTSVLCNSDSMHIDDEITTATMSSSKASQGNSCSLASQNDYTSCENKHFTRENNDVSECQPDGENDCSSIPHSTGDACLDNDQVNRNCKSRTDEMADIGSDMQQNNTSLEVGRNQNDHGGVEIACYAEAAETVPISRDLRPSDNENQLYEAHICIEPENVQYEDKQNFPVLSSVIDFDQLPGFSALQNCCIDQVEDSPKNNQGYCSIDDLLHRSSCEENNKEIIIDSVIDCSESSDVYPPECPSNCDPIASPKDNCSAHEEIRETRKGDNILGSLEIDASLRSSSCSTAKSSEFGKIPSGEGTSETSSKEIVSEASTTCNDQTFCSPTKDLGLLIAISSCENVQQYGRDKELDNLKSPEMNGTTLCQNESELSSEMDHLLETEMCSTYNDNAQLEARTICNDSPFCSLTKDSGPSISNDDILSRENIEQYMEAKDLENQEMTRNTLCQNESEINSETDHLHDTEMCSTCNDNPQSEAIITCNGSSFCSPTKALGSSIPNEDILSREKIEVYLEAIELENHKSPNMNGNLVSQNENELNSEMHRLDAETCSTYADNSQSLELRKSEVVGKQNVMGTKTSTNAAPFSEEWLAALEAAGEEILTMKTGAVQNSPPDKSQPEPGPWSPGNYEHSYQTLIISHTR
ncbi:uncharacterized protein LOC105435834 isoform X3 [Cucumis sativus]|uniref:uncharacterized protein LOC105435834 isoform X3 n=1 Tax=Cucumis sativus TaxID=3659 RepID=UPI0012F4D327|nr:uncharacterized protein LOC105435834 isoform X3 [Cucumis sativus]KAE8647062.1 hypothetical protein Csa_022989 [Cucumis sativus]